MTTTQKRKILIKIQTLEKDIDELKRCRTEIALNGYSSATIASNGGSKSYTRLDVGKVTEAIMSLTKELQSYKDMLANESASQFQFKSILHVYG